MQKKHTKIIIMLLLLTGAAFIYFTFDPAKNKYFPPCPFHKITGLFCPGCGAQRCIHYLLRGNLTAAMHSNILLVLFLPFLMVYYGIQTFNYINPQNSISIGIIHKVWFIYFLAILFLVYWIARNIPLLGSNILAPH